MKKQMKTLALSVLTIGSILLSASAMAQVNNGSPNNGSNESGNGGAAPATVELETIGRFIKNRFHTLNLDAQMSGMQPGSKRNFLAGFSAEGALIYQYEIDNEKMPGWDDIGRNAGTWGDIGRNAGIQIMPYSAQILQDGSKKVSFSALAFRNMNAVENSYHHATHLDLFKVMDRLDLLTFSWDRNISFSNIQSFDFQVVNTSLKVGLHKIEANTSYLAFRASGYGGGKVTTINNIEEKGYRNTGDMGWSGEYSGGLELNLQATKGARFNLQSNYVAGGSGITLENTSVAEKNAANHADYQSKIAQHNAASDQSQLTKPTDTGNMRTKQTLVRTYGYVKNSVDVSLPLKQSWRPMRLGLGVDVNVVLFDQAVNKSNENFGSATKIDFSGNYNQAVRGRLYLNF